ncbi:hypothetical protein F2Q69_00013145 [Brassica cretica]|uniref:Serpin domain-containing protein n=1 Tax=Brassica cretica TaxID=69181 RepID=A0A8S9R248_BRACR|nr:hypothetical protein F2Q69_00013145 [Brassica cretica]
MEPKKKKKQKLSNSQVFASPSLSQEELREAMKKLNDTALVLTSKAIDADARNSNFVFSPASISAALTMMAVTNGTHSDELNAVYKEIATVVLADDSASGGPKISAVNAEEVRIELNKWASDHTNGLIRDILPPGFVTSKSVKVCGNALYFKGAWEKKFDKSLTKDKMFHLLVGKPVRVPFMSSHKDQYIKAYDGFKVLGLPYRQGRDDDTNRKFRCISIFRTRKMG